MAVVTLDDDYLSIAARLGVDPLSLQRANNFADLNVGQTINIPPRPGRKAQSETVMAGRAGQEVSPPRKGSAPAVPLPQTGQAVGVAGTVASAGKRPPAGFGNQRPTYEMIDGVRYPAVETPGLPTPNIGIATGGKRDETRRNMTVGAFPGTSTYTPTDAQRQINDYYSSMNRQPQYQNLPGSGTFTQSNVDLWDTYFNNPQALMQTTNPKTGITALDQISGQIANEYGGAIYNNAILDFLGGQQDAYGNVNFIEIPTAVLGQVDVSTFDPDWYEQYSEVLASLGYTQEDVSAFWLANFGYQFDENGMFMTRTEDTGYTVGGSGSSGGGSGGNRKGYGGYGGGSGGYSRYSSAVSGLVNWRGVGFA